MIRRTLPIVMSKLAEYSDLRQATMNRRDGTFHTEHTCKKDPFLPDG